MPDQSVILVPKLILASKSAIRRQLLENAGVPFSVSAASIDEDAIKTRYEKVLSPDEIALLLAREKALACEKKAQGNYILGCDQILSLEGRIFNKPRDRAETYAHLKALSGKTHQLYTAAAIVHNGEMLWQYIARADLKMRACSDIFLHQYMDDEGEILQQSVGAYRLENKGIQLFDAIDGDYFAILGLPLFEILKELRRLKVIEE